MICKSFKMYWTGDLNMEALRADPRLAWGEKNRVTALNGAPVDHTVERSGLVVRGFEPTSESMKQMQDWMTVYNTHVVCKKMFDVETIAVESLGNGMVSLSKSDFDALVALSRTRHRRTKVEIEEARAQNAGLKRKRRTKAEIEEVRATLSEATGRARKSVKTESSSEEDDSS